MTLLNVTLISSLVDNYTPILVDTRAREAVIVDPSESQPVLDFMRRENLSAKCIFLTHHHVDHIAGVSDITERFAGCDVIGFKDDQYRLPPLTRAVRGGDLVSMLGRCFEIWSTPGHTSGHIIYVCHELKLAFVGDVIFGGGCGRVFEGTYQQMFSSLQKLKQLPDDYQLFCAHEYTQRNLEFALSQYSDNCRILERVDRVIKCRSEGHATVPLSIGEERLTNPFLLAQDVREFSVLRDARNAF
jgi:hydroxyacylglutathione hydrolase